MVAVAAHHHQLTHRNGKANAAALRQVAQQAGRGGPAQAAHFLPQQLRTPLVRQLAREHPEERGFAAAVVAHYGHKSGLGQAQKKVADQHPSGVARNQIIYAERGSCRG